jgi:outer membrane protein assembly factor BamB
LYVVDAQTGQEKWSFKPEEFDMVRYSPAVAGDTVYFGGYYLYAVDTQTGEQKWEFETAGEMRSPAIGDDGTVYFGIMNDYLYAVDGQTGEEKWKIKLGGIPASPAIANGTVYVSFSGLPSYGRLYAVDIDTRQERWHSMLTGGCSQTLRLRRALSMSEAEVAIIPSMPWMLRPARNYGVSKQRAQCTLPR